MTIYLLLILSLFLCQHTSVQAANSALCFLTHKPASQTIEFAEELAEDALLDDVDIFIMIDDNSVTLSGINISSDLQLLQIPNDKCLQYNYKNAIWLRPWEKITSWDKALLYFSLFNKNHSFVWLIESDVFIPSVQAFRSLHELYSDTSDLIVPTNGLNLLANTSFWNWRRAVGQFIPPWSGSMANVVGLSRRMFTAIDDYVQWLGRVPYHEFFFTTLAIQLNFTIVTPTELSTDVFSTKHVFEDICKRPNNLWHPVKDLAVQKLWRERLTDECRIIFDTIELTNLEMLCHTNQNMTRIKQHLTHLLIKFEINKSKFSSNNRRLLRQRFTNLAEQCQNRNASKEIISLAMTLADHAYKLPELPVGELVINKSAHHLKLEQALKKKKESIYRLSSNSSIVEELRNQTVDLIKELTSEIQREYKEEQERRKPS